jgi:hypothetical protein
MSGIHPLPADLVTCARMSATGQRRKLRLVTAMYALPPKPDLALNVYSTRPNLAGIEQPERLVGPRFGGAFLLPLAKAENLATPGRQWRGPGCRPWGASALAEGEPSTMPAKDARPFRGTRTDGADEQPLVNDGGLAYAGWDAQSSCVP